MPPCIKVSSFELIRNTIQRFRDNFNTVLSDLEGFYKFVSCYGLNQGCFFIARTPTYLAWLSLPTNRLLLMSPSRIVGTCLFSFEAMNESVACNDCAHYKPLGQ